MSNDFEKKCCKNCKNNFMIRCEKLKKLPEYAATLSDGVQDVSLFSERFIKRSEIEGRNCCDSFSSYWIEYPIAVSSIEKKSVQYNEGDCGYLVKIRPCKEECEGKTYIGIYLGDLPTNISSSLNRETRVLSLSTHTNPAIFVPELKQIIFGYESWWGRIKSLEELKEITNEDINNIWYVKLLKS